MLKSLISAAMLALITVASLGACDDDDVGIECEGGGGATTSTGEGDTGGFEITQSLDCESRICITDKQSVNPIARCTRLCSDDGDCPSEGPNCTEGFLCRVGTRVDILGLGCCKLCICKDDLSQAERERDDQAQRCEDQGIEPQCPEL
jgi:hypothetical protein